MPLNVTDHAPEVFAQEIGRLYRQLKDLYHPKPWIYWTDLGLSALAGWSLLFLSAQAEPFGAAQAALVALSSAALYRALAFTHELAHLRAGAVPGLRAAWDLVAGIPLLAPHFLYRGTHAIHHRHPSYGTERDAEYLPLAEGPPERIVRLFAMVPLQPLLMLLRFGVLEPLSLLHPAARRWVLRHCSTMGLRFAYARALPAGGEVRAAAAEAGACCAFVWGMAALLAWGALPLRAAGAWYAVWTAIGTLNLLRCIGATHRYHGTGERMTLPEQLDDSVNVASGSIATAVLCPAGLRWHALHHLFPGLPYHALGTAHRRIMAGLPPESFYRATLVPSVAAGFAGVWRAARRARPSVARSGFNTEAPSTRGLTEEHP